MLVMGLGCGPSKREFDSRPALQMIKVYLTECPKCHEVYQVSEVHFYSFNPCISFKCTCCGLTYMLIANALDCLVCSGSHCKKQKKDIALESPGCMSEKVY